MANRVLGLVYLVAVLDSLAKCALALGRRREALDYTILASGVSSSLLLLH